jgi:hypothetical protein
MVAFESMRIGEGRNVDGQNQEVANNSSELKQVSRGRQLRAGQQRKGLAQRRGVASRKVRACR